MKFQLTSLVLLTILEYKTFNSETPTPTIRNETPTSATRIETSTPTSSTPKKCTKNQDYTFVLIGFLASCRTLYLIYIVILIRLKNYGNH